MAIAVDDWEELEVLHQRYIDGDPSLTSEQIDDMRRSTSTSAWQAVEERRKAKQAKVTPITSGRSDQQIAEELREDLRGRLEQIGELVSKARREHGMTVSFQFAGPDSFGRTNLVMLEIAKKLC